ncbi:hypothetical protein GCK72_002942 [Caenorhabditis remanei]|uniref:Uncharacterized protein n=1 Tax=Caenorhabditis remanei TaxID=31234 RepID=A0A6A5HXB8_CAERE|nr:hypothetical protein GCK72_002942 [Caenorhabditis remanei]KAF1771117.1 hypothetical protein GCK72_002942 [Caenorhabditis remanei]
MKRDAEKPDALASLRISSRLPSLKAHISKVGSTQPTYLRSLSSINRSFHCTSFLKSLRSSSLINVCTFLSFHCSYCGPCALTSKGAPPNGDGVSEISELSESRGALNTSTVVVVVTASLRRAFFLDSWIPPDDGVRDTWERDIGVCQAARSQYKAPTPPHESSQFPKTMNFNFLLLVFVALMCLSVIEAADPDIGGIFSGVSGLLGSIGGLAGSAGGKKK